MWAKEKKLYTDYYADPAHFNDSAVTFMKANGLYTLSKDEAGKPVEVFAVPLTTVTHWRHEKKIRAAIGKKFYKDYEQDEVPIKQSLVNKALDGDVEAIKLFARWIKKWVPLEKVEHEGNITLTPAEIRAALTDKKEAAQLVDQESRMRDAMKLLPEKTDDRQG